MPRQLRIQYEGAIYHLMSGGIGVRRFFVTMWTGKRFLETPLADGFSVEVLGRTGLRYREEGRQMFVDSEVLTGPSGMALYKDTIQKRDPPYDSVPVTDSDRDRILKNIRHALRSQGFETNVI